MGFRFRKSISIIPGVKLNMSKSGVSTTIGRRGMSINVGKNGVRGTVGIPGTGLSYSEQLVKFNDKKQSDNDIPIPSYVVVEDDGEVYFADINKNYYPQEINEKMKKIFKEQILKALEEKEKQINDFIDEVTTLHHRIYPNTNIFNYPYKEYSIELFSEPFQTYDEFSKKYSFFEKLMKEKEIRKEYSKIVEEYNRKKNEHENKEKIKKEKYEELVKKMFQGNIQSMEELLDFHLNKLEFLLETYISYQVVDNHTVFVDIDLPEIEDIPTKKVKISRNKLVFKEMTKKEINKNYFDIVIGTGLFVTSFIFHVLPVCDTIILSGYTQRVDKSTGKEKNSYIYSLEIDRKKFYNINFNNVDLLLCLNNFEPIIKVDKDYYMNEISPYVYV